MKKEQFRSMVKEIIKEVITEMDECMPAEEGKQHSQYPKADAPGTEDGKSSDDKVKSRNAAWQRWGQGMKTLKGIHDEPGFKKDIHNLRVKQYEEPPDHKTM